LQTRINPLNNEGEATINSARALDDFICGDEQRPAAVLSGPGPKIPIGNLISEFGMDSSTDVTEARNQRPDASSGSGPKISVNHHDNSTPASLASGESSAVRDENQRPEALRESGPARHTENIITRQEAAASTDTAEGTEPESAPLPGACSADREALAVRDDLNQNSDPGSEKNKNIAARYENDAVRDSGREGNSPDPEQKSYRGSGAVIREITAVSSATSDPGALPEEQISDLDLNIWSLASEIYEEDGERAERIIAVAEGKNDEWKTKYIEILKVTRSQKAA
jgi:hypothetical protein